jgi:protein O-GlcNAc transferase
VNDSALQSAWNAHRSGNLTEAARQYGNVLKRDPHQFDALYGLGVLLYQEGRFSESEALLARANKRNPRQPEPFFTLGCALHRLGRADEALAAFDGALALRPSYPEALVNKGGVLMAMRRFEEALSCFEAALAANPSFAQGWINRGNALSELGRHDEAAESYDRLLKLHPGAPEALLNKGTALLAAGRHADAAASYTEALRADPSLAAARGGLANALFSMKRYEEAAREYAGALRVDPELAYGQGNLGFAKLHACDWAGLDEIRTRIVSGLAARKTVINPFQAIALLKSEQDHLRASTLCIQNKYAAAPHPDVSRAPYRHEKIRVAYVSADFGEHAVSTLLAGVLERHDRERFETFAVSLSDGTESAMRTRLKRAFAHFQDAGGKKDSEIAAYLRENEIDIAVDLTGFTGECRPGILLSRPAPVQVNYLGFPGTMGAPHIDYIIADKTVLPQSSQGFYAECPAYLPDSFLPGDSTRAISPARPSRASANLPEDGFVFASFNNSYKFTPEIFRVWMRLLWAIPGSVLWLAAPNAAAMRNLSRKAKDSGVAPERICFAPFAERPEDHLARLPLADLFLDTLPYNAHSTASDALWAGLPVLTCMGSTFAGRVGASLLTAIGMPELIARDLADYEAKALALARDRNALAQTTAKLRANLRTSPLFDTARYTRALEGLFTRMWMRHQRGLPPEAIE